MAILLKNISKEFSKDGAVLDIEVTENPITRTRQWTEFPIDETTGLPDKIAGAGFDPADESKAYHIVIKPGETMEFGKKTGLNEEQAEYVYKSFGDPETTDSNVNNWLIEVDEKGEEKKGVGTLHWKYRKSGNKQTHFTKVPQKVEVVINKEDLK